MTDDQILAAISGVKKGIHQADYALGVPLKDQISERVIHGVSP